MTHSQELCEREGLIGGSASESVANLGKGRSASTYMIEFTNGGSVIGGGFELFPVFRDLFLGEKLSVVEEITAEFTDTQVVKFVLKNMNG
jgi:hypothetical protein